MSTPPSSPDRQYPTQRYPDQNATGLGSPAGADRARGTSTWAVLGLVFAFVLPLVGFILSIVGITKTGPNKEKGRGLAIAGLVLSVIGTIVWSVIGIAALAGLGEAIEQTTETQVVSEDEAPAEPGADDAPVDDAAAEPVPGENPESFEALTPEAWEAIVRDPEAREGAAVTLHAEVFQIDTNTGAERFLANAGPAQPAGEFELSDLVFVTAPGASLAEVAEGDVLRIDAVIEGAESYDTALGAANTVAAIRAVTIQQVGYLDLTPSVVLGAPEPQEFGGVDVPVTVTNSGTETSTFSISLVAVSADAATQVDTSSAYVENLAPGQTAEVSASFFDDLPEGTVVQIAEIDRYAP